MKIKNVGIDIVEVKKFRKIPYVKNQSFYTKIFTDQEIKYCLSKSNPHQHFAGKFAAKEAVIKSLGSTIYKAKNIEILNKKDGSPRVKLQVSSFPATDSIIFQKARLATGGKIQVLISISHTKDYATAVALMTNS